MSKRTNDFEIFRVVLVGFFLVAFLIGGFAHFAEVIVALLVLATAVVFGGIIIYFTLRSRSLRTPTKAAICLAVVGLALLGLWKVTQPPSQWPAIDIRVASVAVPPIPVEFTCLHTVRGQSYTARFTQTYPNDQAAAAGARRSGRTTIFYNPADPTEVEEGHHAGWVGNTAFIGGTRILPATGTPVVTYRAGLFSAQEKLTLPVNAPIPSAGQIVRVYANPANSSQFSLVPRQEKQPIANLGMLVTGALSLAGSVVFGFISWRRRGNAPPEITPPVVASRVWNEPKATVITSESLRAIDWYQFEQVIARLLFREGWTVTRKGGAKADGGVDLVAQRGTETRLVQCKHWLNWKVKESLIRELVGTLTIHGGDRIALYTLNPCTGPAYALAMQHRVEIVMEDEILHRLNAVGVGVFTDLMDPNVKHCPICEGPMILHTGGFKPFWGCSRFPKCRGKIETN